MTQHFFEQSIYAARRKKLVSTVGSGLILFLGNKEASINFKDNWYPFRQDSSFLYYFGISQPDLAGIIDIDNGAEYLFGDELTIDQIVWTGNLPSLTELAEKIGVSNVLAMSKLESMLSGKAVHYLPPYRSDHSITLSQLLSKSIDKVNSGYSAALINAIAPQRAIKSKEEIVELDKAVSITSAMHLAVMKAARPGMKEHELVGVAKKVASDHNVSLSFPPILTKDGQILHSHYHGNTLKDGDMLLFDGGTESESFYAGDMTRTFPVGKTFTAQQKEMYQVMHDAHVAAIAMLAPGQRFLDIHLHACQKLVEGLKNVGLMKGDPEEAVAAGAHTMFFQCGLGHFMGLDVHDMENLGEQCVGYTDTLIKSTEFGLKSLRLGRTLEEGHVVTVEPGLYLIPELIDLNKAAGKYLDFINYDKLEAFRDFGGMRVEDDFVITKTGADLLGTPLASSIEDIEAIRTAAL